MTKKHVKERRERLQQIGVKDREARCPECWLPRERNCFYAPWCSRRCQLDAEEYQAKLKEARR